MPPYIPSRVGGVCCSLADNDAEAIDRKRVRCLGAWRSRNWCSWVCLVLGCDGFLIGITLLLCSYGLEVSSTVFVTFSGIGRCERGDGVVGWWEDFL